MISNKEHMSLREGKVFLDGVQILDAVKFDLVFKPEVATSRVLGERGQSRRYIGYDITGSITEYKSTPWLKNAINGYLKSGATPEFVIQGIQDDSNSSYVKRYGSDVITCSGCVLTGDLPLSTFDANGQLVQQTVAFGAHDLV